MNNKIKTSDILLLRVNEGKVQVLLTKRGPNVYVPNKWCIPGGHIDDNEVPMDGGIRELKEETNIDVSPIKSNLKVLDIHPISEIRKGYGITYTCVLPPDFKYTLKPQSEEISEIKWFYENEIPHDQMAFDHGDIVDGLMKRIKQA
jgi:8-oxo-dGTP pyrophosphatase MutT (NUDIX family)